METKVPYHAGRPERFEVARQDTVGMAHMQALMLGEIANDISAALWQEAITRAEAVSVLEKLIALLQDERRRP